MVQVDVAAFGAIEPWQSVPVRGWKYVNECDARFLEQGSIRLREFAAYAALESDRADPLDSAVRLDMGELDLDDPAHRAMLDRHGALERMGIRLPPMVSHGLFHNNTIIDRAAGYAFCASRIGTPYEPEGGAKQAVFEVDLFRLADTLLRENRHKLSPQRMCGNVEYRPVRYTERDEPRTPSPLVKDPRFAHEREVRLTFAPAVLAPVEQIIDTPPSQAVAACFRRIG